MEVVDNIALTDVYYVSPSFTHFPYNPTADIISVSVLPCNLAACSDVTYDGRVSIEDFAVLASEWMNGECNSANGFCDGSDLDYNGSFNTTDLSLLISHWLETVGSEPQASDLIENGLVNIEDLVYFLSHWLDTGCSAANDFCDRCDLNRSGRVDTGDFALLGSNWQVTY